MTTILSFFGTFFLPGPTEVRPEILAAMVRPMISHRGPQFEALFERIQAGLQDVFRTARPVYVSTSSGTGLMECGVRCAPPGRLLALVNGVFSERFATIAEACGREVDRYEVAYGEVHHPDVVAEYLGRNRYAALTVVHSETSTGALNDVRAIADVARRHLVRTLVDSVSGIAGAELHTDAWQLDYVFTASQKALALPPGLAFAVASAEFVEQARDVTGKGVYFDVVQFDMFARRSTAPNTPAISLYYALERQLQDVVREGVPARWARHVAMAESTARWVDLTRQRFDVPSLRVLAAPGDRSPTVTTITLPERVTSDALVEAVARRGFTIGTGRGALRTSTVRIGHMGDHTPAGLEACLSACADALAGLLA